MGFEGCPMQTTSDDSGHNEAGDWEEESADVVNWIWILTLITI